LLEQGSAFDPVSKQASPSPLAQRRKQVEKGNIRPVIMFKALSACGATVICLPDPKIRLPRPLEGLQNLLSRASTGPLIDSFPNLVERLPTAFLG
jgi:hypothetical protein